MIEFFFSSNKATRCLNLPMEMFINYLANFAFEASKFMCQEEPEIEVLMDNDSNVFASLTSNFIFQEKNLESQKTLLDKSLPSTV